MCGRAFLLPLVSTVLTLELFAGLSACPAPYCYINQLCIF
nr:MAG TPA_asm: hypothetical protein [Bacteriophage sp.]